MRYSVLGDSMDLKFKVGDHAVYPGQGVGQLVSIESKEVCGTTQTFYTIHIIQTGMKVMIPQLKAQSIGLRHIVGPEEAEKILAIFEGEQKKIKPSTISNWNRRYKDYLDRVRSGSIYEIVEIIRELKSIQKDKELSFGEKKVFTMASQLLKSELSFASENDKFQKRIKTII